VVKRGYASKRSLLEVAQCILQVESMFMVAHDGESKDDFFVSSRVYCFVSVSVGGTSLVRT